MRKADDCRTAMLGGQCSEEILTSFGGNRGRGQRKEVLYSAACHSNLNGFFPLGLGGCLPAVTLLSANMELSTWSWHVCGDGNLEPGPFCFYFVFW
jgi:hypothetical protein